MAVQIARLRLFIAITAAREIVQPFQVESDPLPNLEAIIVCADTLETVADPDWRSVQLDMSDPQIGEAVREIVNIRSRWFEVHSENQKMELLKRDVDLRAHLERLLDRNGALASSEMRAFTKAGLMTTGPAPNRRSSTLSRKLMARVRRGNRQSALAPIHRQDEAGGVLRG